MTMHSHLPNPCKSGFSRDAVNVRATADNGVAAKAALTGVVLHTGGRVELERRSAC